MMRITRFLLSLGLFLCLCSTRVQAQEPDETARPKPVLATCPDDIENGYFYNNGRACIRDKQTWNREIVAATCPDEHWQLRKGWCKRKFHTKVRPTCPPDYQLYSKDGNATCHSPCPDNTKAYKGLCVQPRAVLAPTYMVCPDDAEHNHRFGVYCCSMKLGNCPRVECRLEGTTEQDTPPGKFYYDEETGRCERQVHSVQRTIMPRISNGKRAVCPDGTVRVRDNVCQAPCPAGYRAMRGKCVLPYCAFDTKEGATVVNCPEGTYALPREPL